MKEATHKLESQDRCHQQGPNPAYPKCHSPPKEPRTGVVNRDQIQLTMEATHSLESQGQLLSAGTKSSSPQKQLTRWRAKGRHYQQGKNPTHHGSHSLPEEPQTGIISRDQIQLTTEATHKLEPRKCIVSRYQLQITMEATHKLESQCHQQGQNPAHHGSHSQTGAPRTGVISRDQIQLTTEATHLLENQRQVLSAGTKSSSPQKPLTPWRAKDRCGQQGQIQLTMEATHSL